jgi:hypothetical protein
MTPDTEHFLLGLIRAERGSLSSLMKWNLSQPHSSTRIEIFEIIAFRRELLNQAERKIAAGDIQTFTHPDIVAMERAFHQVSSQG